MINTEDVYFMFVIFNLAAGIGVLFLKLYIVCFELDKIFSALRGSYGLELYKPFLQMGLLSKIFVVGSISSMIFFYKKSIKTGRLDQGEYENFTPVLKFQLRALYLMSLLLGLMMLVLFALGVWMGWLE